MGCVVAIASICHGQHSRASSLVREYALGLSRLRGARYQCDCAYRKLHLALQSLAKDHVIMRYMSCLRKLHERTSIWMSLILKLLVCDIIFGEPQGQTKFSVGTILRSPANFGWGRAVQ